MRTSGRPTPSKRKHPINKVQLLVATAEPSELAWPQLPRSIKSFRRRCVGPRNLLEPEPVVTPTVSSPPGEPVLKSILKRSSNYPIEGQDVPSPTPSPDRVVKRLTFDLASRSSDDLSAQKASSFGTRKARHATRLDEGLSFRKAAREAANKANGLSLRKSARVAARQVDMLSHRKAARLAHRLSRLNTARMGTHTPRTDSGNAMDASAINGGFPPQCMVTDLGIGTGLGTGIGTGMGTGTGANSGPRTNWPHCQISTEPAPLMPGNACGLRPDPVHTRGYLVFLREYRSINENIPLPEIGLRGAHCWCAMSERQRSYYECLAQRFTFLPQRGLEAERMETYHFPKY